MPPLYHKNASASQGARTRIKPPIHAPLLVLCAGITLVAGCPKGGKTGERRQRTRVVAPESPGAPASPATATAAIKAPAPKPEVFPLYGVVYHYLAQVFEKPSAKSKIVGYMRRGAFFRARPASAPQNSAGCKGAWYEVPGNGFVCSTRGFQIGTAPQTFDPSPVPPSLTQALPYPYGRTSVDDVPQYYHLPSPEEELQAKASIEALRTEEARVANMRQAVERLPSEANPDVQSQADEIDAPLPPGQHASQEANGGEGTGSTPATSAMGTDAGLALPLFLRLRMRAGFYISLDRLEVTDDGRRFYRTVRGSYVPADAFTEVVPPTMRGVVLGNTWQLPIAFVYKTAAHVLRRVPETAPLTDQGIIERHTPIVVQQTIEKNGKKYIVGSNGSVVRLTSVRLAAPARRPPIVPAGAKWIHIRLSEQTLVAYEGDKPVFATLVSSGEDEHKTPTGIFQIQSKHVSATMDDMSTPETTYSIEDVPWTMYFHGNYALHGAFWHNGFGRVRSHGCVNLSPVDARWLFLWSEPRVPASWHGVFTHTAANFRADAPRRAAWVIVEA